MSGMSSAGWSHVGLLLSILKRLPTVVWISPMLRCTVWIRAVCFDFHHADYSLLRPGVHGYSVEVRAGSRRVVCVSTPEF